MIYNMKAYAKINIGLRIVKRKKNGYHILKSLMSLIDFYDELIFEESDIIEVYTDPCICDEKDNLCHKVAVYMKQYAKTNKGIRIYIKKNIPTGGGLGGGSSNAACVLNFLNEYWCIRFSEKKLMKIAFMFGADIPFFVKGKQSFVSGYGEIVKPIKKVINKDIILILPNFNLSTKEVFQKLDINKIKKRQNKKLVFPDNIYNDMEQSANLISGNKIEEIKEKVKKVGSGTIVMSGSGSAIVYYIDEQEEKSKVLEKIKEELPECVVILSKIKQF